jgi:hypothetical protein
LITLVVAVVILRRQKKETRSLEARMQVATDAHRKIREEFIREFGARLAEGRIQIEDVNSFEIDAGRLVLGEELGRGAFGVVRLAELRPASSKVG